VSDKHRTN